MLKKLWGAFVDGLVDKWKSSLFKKKIQEDCEYHSLFETKMTKINTLFITKMTTIHTLWGHTYLHRPLRGVPPPLPSAQGCFPCGHEVTSSLQSELPKGETENLSECMATNEWRVPSINVIFKAWLKMYSLIPKMYQFTFCCNVYSETTWTGQLKNRPIKT